MPGIVCAIRGGTSSRKTINKAVKLASEVELPLYFVYVINLEFLTNTSSSRVKTLTQEMQQMSDFILLAAKEKAYAQGIEAQSVVRQGTVSEEIIDVCHQIGANFIVLGQPIGQSEEDDIFTQERLNTLKKQIEAESGAKVILVKGDEIE